MVIFHSYVNVYQRVTINWWICDSGDDHCGFSMDYKGYPVAMNCRIRVDSIGKQRIFSYSRQSTFPYIELRLENNLYQ
jgi:hypothetical protein